MNIELLDDAINIIKENPEHWNQETWHCGTSHCIAGHIYLMIHDFPYDYHEDNLTMEQLIETFPVARKALGITKGEAQDLFSPFNTLDDLISIRNKLASNYNV